MVARMVNDMLTLFWWSGNARSYQFGEIPLDAKHADALGVFPPPASASMLDMMPSETAVSVSTWGDGLTFVCVRTEVNGAVDYAFGVVRDIPADEWKQVESADAALVKHKLGGIGASIMEAAATENASARTLLSE